MKREILFRGWDVEEEKMFHSDKEELSNDEPVIWEIDCKGVHYETMDLINEIIGGESEQYFSYTKPEQIIMQYTGLKDKNGVKIFEGDILSMKFSSDTDLSLHEVYYKESYTSFWLRTKSGILLNVNLCHELFDFCSIEVIGNIHENPELLEEK